MERRDSERLRRRIPCEFTYEGHTHAAIVVDVSVGGLFLQTDVAVTPGTELTIRLRGETFTGIELRGSVVRRRFTPLVIASLIRRGLGLRLSFAPPAWFEALGGGEEPDETAWTAVADVEEAFEDESEDGRVSLEVPLPPPASPVSFAAPTPRDPPEKPEATESAGEETWESLDAVAREVVPSWQPGAAPRADALLVHTGDLADVAALLEDLGARVRSQPSIDADGFASWERPPRMLVASGKNALRLAMGANIEAQGTVPIAVVDSASQTLCGMLRRQGFRYVVRRPVHPDALRLLLGRALYRGRERRDGTRVALGCEVGVRFRLRRKTATLVELSRAGCRLLAPDWLEPGDALTLRIPEAVTGNRPLVVGGRVVRSERRRRPSGPGAVAVALRFDRLDDEVRMRLDALLAAHSLGPCLAPRPALAPPPSRTAGKATAAPGAPALAADAERRGGRRVLHRSEVVALDPRLARVRHALLGIDLSLGGLRVEPHPDLVLGDRLRLALYDAAAGGPLALSAEVVRDDGTRGLVLRFVEPSPEERARLAVLVESMPRVEALVGQGSRALVVGELLEAPGR